MTLYTKYKIRLISSIRYTKNIEIDGRKKERSCAERLIMICMNVNIDTQFEFELNYIIIFIIQKLVSNLR